MNGFSPVFQTVTESTFSGGGGARAENKASESNRW